MPPTPPDSDPPRPSSPSADEWGEEWSDPALAATEPEPIRLVLPPKRELPLTEKSPTRKRGRVEMGLQISVKMRTGRSITASGAAESDEPETAVIKLECASPDQPFQANQMMVSRQNPALEPPKPAAPLKEENPDWGTQPTHSLRWLVKPAVGVAAVLALALGIQALWLRDPPDTPPATVQLTDAPKLEQIEGFEIDGTSEQDSREMLATFAAATTADAALPLIRNVEALAAKVRLDWQPWGTPPGWEVPFEADWSTSIENGRAFGTLSGKLPDFKPFRAYFVRENGTLKLDWEATLGRGDSSFELLVRGTGSGGLIRAYLMPDWYFTAALPEENYHCFKLVAPDHEQVVWAYARLGDPADTGIMKYFPAGAVLESDRSERPMTVRLAPAPDGAQKNQWLIVEMLHNEWVSP